MNVLGLSFAIAATAFLLLAPRKLAASPFLACAFMMTLGQSATIGGCEMYIFRILIFFGCARVLFRGELREVHFCRIDAVVIAWGVIMIASSAFHERPLQEFVSHSARTYDALGIYFLMRCFTRTPDDIKCAALAMCVLAIFLAIEMLVEKGTGRNLFAVLGGVDSTSAVRSGKIRANGPFANPIDAGTAGVLCVPAALLISSEFRKLAVTSLLASLAIIYCSASSGPILSFCACLFGFCMWKFKDHLRAIRVGIICSILCLAIMMEAPVYFLLARVDITGGSTGWHRAALIQAAIDHFQEWYFAGTDHTIHWMPTGVQWSPDHTDITNHYIKMGVLGGVPLLVAFVLVIRAGFQKTAKMLRSENVGRGEKWRSWVLGCTLFTHAVTFVSITYYDQLAILFFWLLAALASLEPPAEAEASTTSECLEESQGESIG